MTRFKRGDIARVVDMSELKLPKGKPPFAEGETVQVRTVSHDGKSLVVHRTQPAADQHTGWFAARRFEKL
jgi:hypothetical protein